MNLSASAFVAGYVVIFFGVLLGFVWWDRRKQRTRKPFPEDLKLLRMPGEYLWRRVIEYGEADLQWVLLVMMIPILVGGAIVYLVGSFLKSPATGLAVSAVVFVLSLFLCGRWFQVRLRRRADDYLGFFGERYVAEWLEPLKPKGWFVFHDVPCAGATGKFNLDHVAVGPGGIWVVETKTRRKGRARPGFKEHEVFFDGDQVIWPWGEDRTGLRQASDNASWLKEWLKKMTGAMKIMNGWNWNARMPPACGHEAASPPGEGPASEAVQDSKASGSAASARQGQALCAKDVSANHSG